MFRKVARTLTRLDHEGLVNYRVLAQEAQLGAIHRDTDPDTIILEEGDRRRRDRRVASCRHPR